MSSLSISLIRMDGGTQSRAQLDWVAIDEYAGAMREGSVFPSVVVFYDGTHYWLADGFHRVRSAEKASLEKIEVDVRQGTQRDAILYSVSANASHGVRRTNRDKRQAVMMLLNDEEWRRIWGNSEIARRCSVSEFMVRSIRESIFDKNEDAPVVRKATRNGTTYTIDTSNIGKTSAQSESPPDLFGADPVDDILAEEWTWTFDPETQVARCKYCYEQHSDWMHGSRLDFDEPVWICNRCEHATSDENIENVLSREEWQARQDEYEDESIEEEEVSFQPFPIPTVINNDTQYLPQYITEPVFTPQKQSYPLTAANHAISDDPDYDGDEWYTPIQYIEAARRVMGDIDCDPASCKAAQEIVQASFFLTKEDDSLRNHVNWNGRIWLNPPYSGTLIKQFVSKLITQYNINNVTQAIILTNNSSDTSWFQSLLSHYPACFTRGRVQFWRPDSGSFGTRQGQTFFYLGENTTLFREIFSEFGQVVIRA